MRRAEWLSMGFPGRTPYLVEIGDTEEKYRVRATVVGAISSRISEI